jgi:O-antigen/teichoic acid export membrane protein
MTPLRHREVNWAIADQALVSGINFTVTLLLARVLGLEEFGWFAVVWMIILSIKRLQYALILAPVQSIGAKYDARGNHAYFTSVLVQQAGFAVVTASLVLLCAWMASFTFPSWGRHQLALPMAAAAFTDQMQEHLRRWFFSHARERAAFLIDVVSYAGRLLVILWWVTLSEALQLREVLWAIAVAGGVSGLCGLVLQDRWEWDVQAVRDITARHWGFAKWLVASALVESAAQYVMTLVAGAVLGVTAVGAIRATQNVLAPIYVMNLALNNVVPAQASRVYEANGRSGMTKYLTKVAFSAGGAALLIAFVACAAPEVWLRLLYGTKYTTFSNLVYWQAGMFVSATLILPVSAALRALENTRPMFISKGVQAAFALATCYWLASGFGLTGTMFGNLCTSLLALAVLGAALAKSLQVSGTRWRELRVDG